MEELNKYSISDLFTFQMQVEAKLRQSWLPDRYNWEDLLSMIKSAIDYRTNQLKDSIFKPNKSTTSQ